jgi:hypothetical protein
MRTRNFKITGILAVLLAIVLFACSKEDAFQTEPELLSFEQFEVYGEIHNQFMTNVKDNFEPDERIENVDQALNYVNEFQLSFLEKADLKGIDKKYLSDALVSSSELVVFDLTYEKMFLSPNARTSESDEPTLFELVEEANSKGLLDNFEYQSLKNLGEKVKDSYDGFVSDNELKAYISDLKYEWIAQGYTEESENGRIMAYVLAISLSSLEWWEANPDAGLTENSNGRVMALPAWAAADIGGAIVSGAIAASGQYTLTGEVNWEVVGWSALGGGISTSTGAAGKVAGFISKLF